MAGERKVHAASVEVQVALVALKRDRTVNELAAHCGVHRTLMRISPSIFEEAYGTPSKGDDAR